MSPKCSCASYATLPTQEFEWQQEQPIAGEGGDTAGNWASVKEFPNRRKPDKQPDKRPAPVQFGLHQSQTPFSVTGPIAATPLAARWTQSEAAATLFVFQLF